MVKAPELGTKFRHSIHLSSQNAAAALIYFLFLLLRALPPAKVKRRRGNVYPSLTLLVYRDVTLTLSSILIG